MFYRLALLGCILMCYAQASPEIPDKADHNDIGNIYADIEAELFDQLGIEQLISFDRQTGLYNYAIRLNHEVYVKVLEGNLELQVAFSAPGECLDDERLYVIVDVEEKQTRFSTSHKVTLVYNMRFEEDYLGFKRNNRYMYRKE